MKKILSIALVLFLFVSVSNSYAQCKKFAKQSKVELLPYIHDGIYNATVLGEGESAELYKTFYSGQEYRILVLSEEGMPDMKFVIKDANNKILFDNSDNEMAKSWDFKLEASQQLIIHIEVPTNDDELSDEEGKKGCVSVLIGFMNEENTLR